MAIQTLNTIKKWFQTGLKPSQNQFWETWDSFRHKFEKIPLKDIEELETILDAKAEKSLLDEHKNNQTAHPELFITKEDKSQKGLAGGYVPLDEFSKVAYQYLSIINNLTAGGETSLLSAEQGVVLQNQISGINNLLSSDNINLDTIQKIVDAIKQIQISIDTILINDLTTGGVVKALTAEMGKLLQTTKEDKSQKGIAGGYAPLDDLAKIANRYLTIINDLTTGGTESILSAEQGVVLQNQINNINILLSSDNVDLDTIQEIVDAIELVQVSLDTILVNDLTIGGTTKALTAEMGKKLNEIKLTATIATDAETQITVSVDEDNKIVSRSKLFNWWENIKSKVQTISAVWNFKLGIKVNNSTGNYVYSAQILEEMFIAQLVSAGYGTYKVQYGWNTIRMFNSNGFYTQLGFISSTQNNNVNLPNKSGTVALINDFVTAAASTKDSPSLIIPNGILTTSPQNGAIERDSSGQLWETHSGVRSRLISSSDAIILAYKSTTSMQTNLDTTLSSTKEYLTSSTTIGKIANSSVQRLNSNTKISILTYNNSAIKPTLAKIEVFLKINNGLFASHWTGTNPINQIKIMEYSGLNNYGYKNYQNLLLFNIQNSDPLQAQWSTVDFPVQTITDNLITSTDKSYYLRDSANTRTFGAGEASFSFVFVNTLVFNDETNSAGLNSKILYRSDNYALFIETIR